MTAIAINMQRGSVRRQAPAKADSLKLGVLFVLIAIIIVIVSRILVFVTVHNPLLGVDIAAAAAADAAAAAPR